MLGNRDRAGGGKLELSKTGSKPWSTPGEQAEISAARPTVKDDPDPPLTSGEPAEISVWGSPEPNPEISAARPTVRDDPDPRSPSGEQAEISAPSPTVDGPTGGLSSRPAQWDPNGPNGPSGLSGRPAQWSQRSQWTELGPTLVPSPPHPKMCLMVDNNSHNVAPMVAHSFKAELPLQSWSSGCKNQRLLNGCRLLSSRGKARAAQDGSISHVCMATGISLRCVHCRWHAGLHEQSPMSAAPLGRPIVCH